MHVCIFGGTTEGRLLSEFLSELNVKIDLYIATEYGEQFVRDLKNANVHQSRLDKQHMIELFESKSFDFVVDATHPFAKIVSQNVKEAAEYCNLKHYRIIREAEKKEYPVYFDCVESIVSYLNENEGNILLTTGSKDLDKFMGVNNYAERIFVRILPMESSLKRALELGYSNKNIICMQGPFSEDLNTAMINFIGSKYLVTKESAASGGFEEKINACIKTNTKCLVLKMSEEEGITLKKFKEMIRGSI